MRYRRMGRAGIKVSEVSLGGWLTFGEQIDDGTAADIVSTAVDAGVNFIDLADVYAGGAAERTFGKILANYRRDGLVISSKVYWPSGEGVNDRGLSRKHIHESVEASLRRLGTDYVDIYFCHRHDDEVELEEVVMAMDDLVTQGKVLYWGTSVWPASRLAEAAVIARASHRHGPSVEQPRYNMLDRHIEPEIMRTAARHGIGLVVWSPLAQGVLTGKYAEGIPEGSRLDTYEWVRRGITEEHIATTERLRPVANDLGASLAQLALAWTLRRPEVTSVIVGATGAEQMAENLGALDVVLDGGVLDQVEEILGNKPDPLPS